MYNWLIELLTFQYYKINTKNEIIFLDIVMRLIQINCILTKVLKINYLY